MLFLRTAHSFQTYVLCGRSETAQHFLARAVLPTHSRIPHTVWLRNSGSGHSFGKGSRRVADSSVLGRLLASRPAGIDGDYSLVYQSLTETDYMRNWIPWSKKGASKIYLSLYIPLLGGTENHSFGPSWALGAWWRVAHLQMNRGPWTHFLLGPSVKWEGII